jgi:DNA-binding NarL/FixJ family response regulator
MSMRVHGECDPFTMCSTVVAPTAPIKVAIVEDQEKIRAGLVALISGTEGFVCTGGWESMEDALVGLSKALPDIVLVDIGLPGLSGIEGIRLMKERYPDLLALVLTVHENEDRIFSALCMGACGYLLKGTPPARLIESLREAVQGGSPMSPQIARRVVQHFQSPRKPTHNLTHHELRLLGMLVDGHHYQTAAAQLGVSVNTIRFHLRRIYEKLQVHSKSEAVAKALRERLIL